ncbi:hypothetical protein D3C87_1949670 [compost metagenome]
MLAAAIRIDRAVEGNVRRLVAGDDAARPLDLNLRLEGRHLLQHVPAVIDRDPLRRLEPAARVHPGAPSAAALDIHAQTGVCDDRIGNVSRIGRLECSLSQK